MVSPALEEELLGEPPADRDAAARVEALQRALPDVAARWPGCA